jgi:hypothetical protein
MVPEACLERRPGQVKEFHHPQRDTEKPFISKLFAAVRTWC